MLVWAGERCGESFVVQQRETEKVIDYPCVLTPARIISFLAGSALLPELTSLCLPSPPLPVEPLCRASLFALFVSFLVHAAPTIQHLRLPGYDWLSSER